jgi:hypothetical protein
MSESSEGRLHRLWNSSIGLKIVMGLTGLIWSASSSGTSLGNLQIYLGPDTFNSYAQTSCRARRSCCGRPASR